MRGGWRRRSGVLLAVVAACLVWKGEARRGRVLLLGLDGATLRVGAPMLGEGRLPNLARLAREGVWGRLRSSFPLHSPRIWTTIATGKTPQEHGIETFGRRSPDGKIHLYSSGERRVPALWNIVSAAGLSVGVVGWWTSHPPERVRGVMVSDHFLAEEADYVRAALNAVADSSGSSVFPESWLGRLVGIAGDERPLARFRDPFLAAELPAWARGHPLSLHFRSDAALARIALEIQREIDPDLLMVLLPGIDRVSHVLWGGLEPPELYPEDARFSASERAAAAGALRDYYDYVDALVGMLLERYGPRDLVLVVSDHGFEAGVLRIERGLLSGIHEGAGALDGVIFARGWGIRPGTTAGVTIHDVTPTVLAWLGLPVARDMAGGPASFLVPRPIDWIASHDATPVHRLLEAPSSGAEDAIVEQLRGLGYVE